jgi:hypothetical protein
MASLRVEIPENSQNIEGVATIKAPLAKVFGACKDPKLFAQWWCRGKPMEVYRFECLDGVQSGAEAGWRQSVEALGKLLEK